MRYVAKLVFSVRRQYSHFHSLDASRNYLNIRVLFPAENYDFGLIFSFVFFAFRDLFDVKFSAIFKWYNCWNECLVWILNEGNGIICRHHHRLISINECTFRRTQSFSMYIYIRLAIVRIANKSDISSSCKMKWMCFSFSYYICSSATLHLSLILSLSLIFLVCSCTHFYAPIESRIYLTL